MEVGRSCGQGNLQTSKAAQEVLNGPRQTSIRLIVIPKCIRSWSDNLKTSNSAYVVNETRATKNITYHYSTCRIEIPLKIGRTDNGQKVE